MTTATSRSVPLAPAIPADPDLPGADKLLRPEGLGLIGGFLAQSGWRLQAARPVQAMYQPGRSMVVRYQAEARNPGGDMRVLWLCAETRDEPGPMLPAPSDLDPKAVPAQLVSSNGEYLVWSFPYDPTLPAMADAGRGPVVRRAVAAVDDRVMAVSVEPVRYRPHRRAVFRYTVLRGSGQGSSVLYGKVLRPHRAAAFLHMTRAIEASARPRRWIRRRRPAELQLSLPVTDASDGLLLFEPLGGQSLRDLLIANGALPAPGRLPRLLDDLARVDGLQEAVCHPGAEVRREPGRMLRHTRRVLNHITPDLRDRVNRLVDTLEDRLASDPTPVSLVHGDLYDAQVFVGADYSLGLIDLDDVGPGDRAMEAANFSAHLLALALAVPSASPLIRAYRRLARPAFMDHLDVGEPSMAWREALVMLLLAPGSFRVLDPAWPAAVRRRVDIAERLLTEGI